MRTGVIPLPASYPVFDYSSDTKRGLSWMLRYFAVSMPERGRLVVRWRREGKVIVKVTTNCKVSKWLCMMTNLLALTLILFTAGWCGDGVKPSA